MERMIFLTSDVIVLINPDFIGSDPDFIKTINRNIRRSRLFICLRINLVPKFLSRFALGIHLAMTRLK